MAKQDFTSETELKQVQSAAFQSHLGPRLEVDVGVEGGVARQSDEPSALLSLPPLLRTSSMICSHVSGRLAGFAVT